MFDTILAGFSLILRNVFDFFGWGGSKALTILLYIQAVSFYSVMCIFILSHDSVLGVGQGRVHGTAGAWLSKQFHILFMISMPHCLGHTPQSAARVTGSSGH